MSNSLSQPGKEQLHEAFAEAGFELKQPGEEPEVRSIGILAYTGAPNPIHALELKSTTVGENSASDAEIERLLSVWENLTPQEMFERHRELALDPFVAMGDWMVPVTHEAVESWLKGDRLTNLLVKRAHLGTRKMRVEQLRIVYVGSAKAIATYHVVESFTDNPMTYSGNGGAILVHVEDGWRIAAYTKANDVGI